MCVHVSMLSSDNSFTLDGQVILSASLDVTFKIEFSASLDIMLRTLKASVVPSVALVGEVAAGINLLIIQGKFGARLTVMRTFLIPTGTLIAGDSGYQVCLTIDIKIEPLVRAACIAAL